MVEGLSVANRLKRPNRLKRLGLCLLAGSALAVLLQCEIQSASAREIDTRAGPDRLTSQRREVHARVANANALGSSEAASQSSRKPGAGSTKGPYYVDFRARTAASWD